MLLDQLDCLLDELSRLDVEVAVSSIADGHGHQKVEQIIGFDVLWLLVYPSQYLSHEGHIDIISEADVGDRLEEVGEVLFDLSLVREHNELLEVILDELRVDQVLVRLNLEHARLVVDRIVGRVDRRQFVEQHVVLEELWPVLGQADELLDVLVYDCLDLVLLTVVVIELLDELLRVPVDRVAAEHFETKDAILEAHFVVELGENDAQRAERIARPHHEQV